jgi:hypothetical protein
VAPTAPAVNHLLFADDSMLFVKASHAGAIEVKEILEKVLFSVGPTGELGQILGFLQ